MSKSIDTSKLIQAVQSRPVLYDKTERGHSDSEVKANACQAIKEELEMDVDVNTLKLKWKNLRDNYIRRRSEYLQSKKSGAGTSDVRQPKWPWYQQLASLDAFLPDAHSSELRSRSTTHVPGSSRSTTPGPGSSSSTTAVADSSRSTTPVAGSSRSTTPCQFHHLERLLHRLPPCRKCPRYSKDVVMGSLLSQMNSNADQRREERAQLISSLAKETDPEEQFLLSFLPLITSFSKHTKMEFRLKFTQLISEMQLRDKCGQTPAVGSFTALM